MVLPFYGKASKGDPIANVKTECLNEDTMAEYFTMLKDVMTKENLLNNPNQIYNVDETGMSLDHRPPKVIGKRRYDAEHLATKVRLQ